MWFNRIFRKMKKITQKINQRTENEKKNKE